jgi:hypothetical protein
MPCSINNEHLPNETDAVMRAVSLSLGEGWMHSLDRPMPAPPQGPPRGGCILGPHVSFDCNQQLARFKVTIRSSRLQSGEFVFVTRSPGTENHNQFKTQLQHKILSKF